MKGDQTMAVSAAGLRVALLVSGYHAEVAESLRRGAVEAFAGAGGDADAIVTIEVPGAFELVPVAAVAARRKDIHAVVALGCIIRGDTRHDRVLAGAVATALAGLAAECGKPVALGVLTVESLRQARERSGGKHGNKGQEAMMAAIAAARAVERARA
ncbi:MAG: 6,7-dimethyl-8-ribityllumazine synthase [Phycisphaerales bacterium]